MCGHLQYGVAAVTASILTLFAGDASELSQRSAVPPVATQNLYSPDCGAISSPQIRAEKLVARFTGVSSACPRISVVSGGVEKSVLPVQHSRRSPLPGPT